jgi:gliding motility-associated-like protein
MRCVVAWMCLFFCCVFNYATAQVKLDSALVAYFPFSGNAQDVSGNNLHGTAVNTTLTGDRSGAANSAYSFNGVSSYIQMPYSNLYNFSPSGAFSIAAWMQPATDQQKFGAVIVKSPYHADFVLSNWNYGAYMIDFKAMIGLAHKDMGRSTTVFQNSPCWYHVVWSYDNGRWYIYVDGKLESSDVSQKEFILQDGSSKLVMGKKGEAFGDFYKGMMDEVRIYSRLLTIDEIKVLSDRGIHPVAGNDTTVCRNGSFQLSASGASSYHWSPSTGLSAVNIPDPIVTVTNTTRYILAGLSATGCAATDTIDITVEPLPVIAKTSNQDICYGKTSVQLSITGGKTYLWSPAASVSDVSVSNPVVSPSVNTTYHVTIGYGAGCTMEDSVRVNLLPKTKITVSPRDALICSGMTVPLAASGAVSYIWSPAASLDNAQIATPIASPTVTTQYLVTATDANSCQVQDTINVTVSPPSSQAGYYVASAFTPNNDGLNDCFGVAHWKAVSALQFDVYNRWGQKIFTTSNPSKCWDGRYSNAQLAESGNYIYLIRASTVCGEIERKGNVVLIR